MTPENRPVIVHVVHSLQGGGTERMLVTLLRAFDAQRFKHAVVTLRSAGSLAARLPDHVGCRAIESWGRSRLAALELVRFTRQFTAPTIHARNTCCWWDAIVAHSLTRRARLLLGFHGLESSDPFNPRQRKLARLALHAGARFVSVSASGGKQLHDQAGIPTDRIDLLRNGVDLKRFGRIEEPTRQRMRTLFGFDRESFVIGTVGSLTAVKQHSILISAVARAARALPQLRLLIVGEGPLRASLEQQARMEGVGDKICFAGGREDMPQVLGCMDAYVCSSASEGMNNAILEAMATALPIVATDVGDNAALVRDRVEGYIVEPGDPKTIEIALMALARSPDLRRQYAQASRIQATRFGLNRAVDAYEAYYDIPFRKPGARRGYRWDPAIPECGT